MLQINLLEMMCFQNADEATLKNGFTELCKSIKDNATLTSAILLTPPPMPLHGEEKNNLIKHVTSILDEEARESKIQLFLLF